MHGPPAAGMWAALADKLPVTELPPPSCTPADDAPRRGAGPRALHARPARRRARAPRLHDAPGGAQVAGGQRRGLRLERARDDQQVVPHHIELVEQQRVAGRQVRHPERLVIGQEGVARRRPARPPAAARLVTCEYADLAPAHSEASRAVRHATDSLRSREWHLAVSGRGRILHDEGAQAHSCKKAARLLPGRACMQVNRAHDKPEL